MSDTPATTLIRNAAWLVAWDAANKRHVYLRDADIAFRGSEIVARLNEAIDAYARRKAGARDRISSRCTSLAGTADAA